MIEMYDGILGDLGLALSMLRIAENYAWAFDGSMLSKLYDDAAALNKSATNLFYSAGNCSLSIAKLRTDVDALWNGSEVLNLNLAGLLDVLNATYMQAYIYAGIIQQFNTTLYEMQSSIAAMTVQAQLLNASSHDLDEMVKSVASRIILLNISLTEVRQATIDILGNAGVLQEYIKKIRDSIIQASERSLAAFNTTSALMVISKLRVLWSNVSFLFHRMRQLPYITMLWD